MAKRFTDTSKWDKVWFRKLSPVHKCFWNYICDRCDHAGVWEVDFELASVFIGSPIDQNEIKKAFDKQFVELNNGSRWLIKDFLCFQYGSFDETNKMMKPVKNTLEKHGVSMGDIWGINPLKVKEKDKVKEKGIVKGENIVPIMPHFSNSEFVKAFDAYLLMRSKIKKPATTRAQELVLKDLHKVSADTAIEMLNQSIRHSWIDVYPPKKNDMQPERGQNSHIDKDIDSSLGKIATKDMIKNVMRKIPQSLWWKVDKYLQKRYPNSTQSGFADAERELIFEIRAGKDTLHVLTKTIGGVV